MIGQRRLFDEVPGDASGAEISECGLYRYHLYRAWDWSLPVVAFVMLNPSTADASEPDPTMTRCKNFAKDWGFGGFVIVNLFALRSTDPDALKAAADPVGPRNDASIRETLASVQMVVLGWGAHSMIEKRVEAVMAIVRDSGKVPHYLKLTKDGHPGHPLFLLGSLRPIPMEAQ